MITLEIKERYDLNRKNWTVKQVTRSDFTWDEIFKAYTDSGHNLAETAKALTALDRGKVSRQLVRYWVNTEDFDEQGTENYEARQLVAKQRAQDTARHLRRENKALTQLAGSLEEWEFGIELAISKMLSGVEPITYLQSEGGEKLTVEVLISDLQIGKLTSNYNTQIARSRVKEVGESIILAISQKRSAGYDIERVVIAFLGDLIESDEKHLDSARGCDSSTAEQVADCIEVLYKEIVEPLAYQAPTVDVVCIGGNHDHSGHGLKTVKPGRTQLNYPIYTAMKLLCKQVAPHVNFRIPEGVFDVIDIYGSKVLYEHGVGVKVSEEAMQRQKHKRGEQIGQHIFYFRMADKHNVSTFNNAQYVVNGAFFGAGKTGSEFSEICGYHSQPGQWLGFHTPRKDGRTTLYDQFTIQLMHITK